MVTAPPAAEAMLGLFLIRVVIPVAILVGVIWNSIRITMAIRKRLDLPADMKALIKAFEHQTSELDESLARHIGKDTARWGKIEKQAMRDAERQTSGPSAGMTTDPPAAYVPTVPLSVWEDAGEPQRDAWRQAGYLPAEAS